MEKIKKSRTVLRSSFTKVLNSLNALLESDSQNLTDIQVTFELLENKVEELQNIEKQVYDAMLEDENFSEEQLLTETSKADEYVYIFKIAKVKVDKLIQPIRAMSCHGSVQSETSRPGNVFKRQFKLPQIELKKFDGSLMNWLLFWSQFSKIHNDDSIDPEDKFQYLLQAIVPGTRAHDVVNSFPPVGENYFKVIESLKARFGKDDLLVEVYVRELLKIVLQNALGNKNEVSLQSLYDKLESHMRALETLGVTTDKCASILYPLVESCMPEELLRAWQRSSLKAGDNPQDRLNNLMKFMLSEVEGEQRIGLAMSGFGINQSSRVKYGKRPSVQVTNDTPSAASLVSSTKYQHNFTCIFCDKSHKSAECFAAQKMTLDEKNKILKDKKCCFCCLLPGHSIKQCRSNLKCHKCKRRHYVLMCPNVDSKGVEKSNSVSKEISKETDTVQDNVMASSSASVSFSPKVFMQTLVCKLRNPKINSNVLEPVRVLIDTGSQRSYIVADVASKLGYECVGKETIIHSLFGNIKTAEQTHKRYRVFLSNVDNSYKCNFEVLNQSKICGEIPFITSGPWIEELAEKNIYLSDTDEKPLPVSILVGADVAGKLFTGNKIQLSSGLTAMETHLGWTLMGKIPSENHCENLLSSVVTNLFIKEADISDLWSLDLIGIKEPAEHCSKKEKELAVRNNFLETTTINDEGRYEVSLPWLNGHPPLPTNESLAKSRLVSVKKKLKVNKLFEDYDAVFNQWLEEGIIEVVPECEVDTNCCHYLPHRPVVKESSSTTRIRPVFDASAKEKLLPSLNDCLENGPNLMETIPTVLLRFREAQYGIIADIAKAFLQISIANKDRDYLRFLWYNNKDEIITFRHKRVVFGVKCSPFLLGSVIDIHLQRSIENGFVASEIIERLQKSFYVDNVSTSVDDIAHLEQFIEESRRVMSDGKFDLRGWRTSVYTENECVSSIVNVLGLNWDLKSDMLVVNLECLKEFDLSSLTKREILSISHRIFDPIGFVCPVMLYPKILLQRIWEQKIDWDTKVSDSIVREFTDWFNDLISLEKIKIPRWIGKFISKDVECSIHTFCDGSKDAYGTVVFLRIDDCNKVSVQLIAAKSRVTPLKQVSIPRIELLAATVGARLSDTIIQAMEWQNIPIYYWTDSTTVLAWIKSEHNWKVFVWNRVSEILKLTKREQWKYIPGELNPADLPSRGCNASFLLKSKWWEGPEWLRKPSHEWPMNEEEILCVKEIEQERKKSDVSSLECQSLLSTSLKCDWCETSKQNTSSEKPCCSRFGTKWYSYYFSEFNKIVRLVAWIFRFFKNSKYGKTSSSTGELSVDEIEHAEKKLLKVIQEESFKGVKDKKISSLDPFVDEFGLMRLRTKLSKNEDADYCVRYPIVLPANHPTVRLLILNQHKKHCHAGVQILLSNLRERYWILGGRRTVRSVISKCVVCKRQNSKAIEATTATLPVDRLRDSSVFEVTGTDFAGPLYLKKGEKAWICLFTCAVYRAIHLELVTSLSTDSFLQAFRRFIARRGRPSIIYSDNGTNFVGSKNALDRINWKDIEKFSTAQRIQWKLNPPTAPWWGGWWERLVRLVKELLRRVLGKACLTYQEIATVLCDCEVVINSRPLTYLYDGKSELEPLTPNHFLQEIREMGVPDIDQIDKISLNKRLQYLQILRQNFKQRFRKEYLGLLTHKINPKVRDMKLELGELVILECDNTKRIDWPLAVVQEVMPDKDGNIRLARVKTANGTLLRPVKRLHSLEVSKGGMNEMKKAENPNIPDIEEEVKSKYILHWSYRQYKAVPEELEHHGMHVEEIYLRENSILHLPKWMSSLTNLTHLYLAGNNMEEFPADVDKLANLCCLELSRNRLRSLPAGIVRLKRLSHLIVDFNCLQELPAEIGLLKALYMLHVNDNSLCSLPETVCQCVSLSELCLHNNLLTSLPQPIVYLPNLETLSVHGNNLLYLPSVRFLCNCHLTFYNNPHLNYLSYHLTYGHDGNMHHLMSGCGGSIDKLTNLPNMVLTIPQHQRQLVLPIGIRRAFTRPDVPSFLELSLRATYSQLYKVEERNRLADAETLQKLPVELQKTLYNGPTSNCAECNRNIFHESFLSVFLRSHISEHRKLLAVMFLCSYRCLTLYNSQRLHEATIEKVQWFQAQ